MFYFFRRFIYNISKNELIEHYEDVLSGRKYRYNRNTFSTENNRKYLLKYFVDKLLNDKVITCIDDIPKVISGNLFKKYKLYGMVEGYYNSSPMEAILFLYPDKWNKWEFNNGHVSNNLWNNDNILLAVRRLVLNKMKLVSRNDILNVTQDDLIKFRLGSLLRIYNHNIPLLLQNAFPEYYLPTWRFKHTTRGYWDIQDNRTNAFKEYIEDDLKLSLNDIPNVITVNYLKANICKLYCIYNRYYKDLFSLINEIYPNKFKPEDFTKNIGDDGTKLASSEEKIIHNLLLKNFDYITYYENENDRTIKNKYYNKKTNQHYIPDWVLNHNIVVEYFGLYNPKRNTKLSKNYLCRAHEKIEFYTEYCKNNSKIFIALFPVDLENYLSGVKIKLNIL